jgi:hypothetical protein
VIELLFAASAFSIAGGTVTALSDASPRDKWVAVGTNVVGLIPFLAVPADVGQLAYDLQNPKVPKA